LAADFTFDRAVKDAMNDQFLNYLGMRGNPFHVSPNPHFLYLSRSHETALVQLMYGIETRQGIVVLTGDAGTGKTTILNHLLDWLGQRGRSTAFLFHTRVEPIGLLRLILNDFGVPCESRSKSELVKTLHRWLRQRHAASDLPVLILDEAQALPPQTLDEIRLILNVETHQGKLLQIVLSGQPELEEKLQLAALQRLRQRIVFHSRLSALTEEETAAYIAQHLAVAGCSDPLVFPDEVARDIHSISQGIPRVVNVVCEHALIRSCGEGRRVVTPELIERIAVDFGLRLPRAVPTPIPTRPQHRCDVPPPVQPVAVSEPLLLALAEKEATPGPMRVSQAVADAAATGMEAPSIPVPATSAVPDSAVETTPPVGSFVPTADAPVSVSNKRVRYWRKHLSRPVVVMRNAMSAVEQALEVMQAKLADSFRRVHAALPPVAGKSRWWSTSREGSAEKSRTQQGSMEQIEFDTLDEIRPRVSPQLPKMARNAAVATFAKYWRSYCSMTVIAHFAGYFGSKSLARYVREVFDSFVRDCRMFIRSTAEKTPTLGVSAAVDTWQRKPASGTHSNALAVVNWLRQPIGPPRSASPRPVSHGREPLAIEDGDSKPKVSRGMAAGLKR
jgi:general secretion pathway protein A